MAGLLQASRKLARLADMAAQRRATSRLEFLRVLRCTLTELALDICHLAFVPLRLGRGQAY